MRVVSCKCSTCGQPFAGRFREALCPSCVKQERDATTANLAGDVRRAAMALSGCDRAVTDRLVRDAELSVLRDLAFAELDAPDHPGEHAYWQLVLEKLKVKT